MPKNYKKCPDCYNKCPHSYNVFCELCRTLRCQTRKKLTLDLRVENVSRAAAIINTFSRLPFIENRKIYKKIKQAEPAPRA